VLEGKPLIDEFGQYVHADWPGKAHTEDDLKKSWAAEADALEQNAAFPDRDAYGGFASTQAKATGFFRVEQIDGRWWFVDPDGHLFYSTGVNGIGTGSGTRVTGREDYFAAIPKPLPGVTNTFGQGAARGGGRQANFYGANIQRRYGNDWRTNWAQLTAQRMEAWGLNTSYGTGLSDVLDKTPLNKPYVISLRGFQTGNLIMGLPDVYAARFSKKVEAVAARQLAPHKDDPYLLGYFIGNEPPWPGRESQFVDLVLQGDASEMQKHFKAALAKGDTPERRRQLVLDAFARLPRRHQRRRQKSRPQSSQPRHPFRRNSAGLRHRAGEGFRCLQPEQISLGAAVRLPCENLFPRPQADAHRRISYRRAGSRHGARIGLTAQDRIRRTCEPFIARQRMRLNKSSGHWSSFSSGSFAETQASLRSCGRNFLRRRFISSSGTLFVTASNAVKSGVLVKQSNIGVAVASIWFIGGRPSINSIVRSRLVWLYCVLTTAPRFV
jgi:hypothetical protein